MKSNFLSIIIPAYRARETIEESIKATLKTLQTQNIEYEIICVIDGKVDDSFEIAQKVAKNYPKIVKVLGYKNNKGKGYAVRYGMNRARGDIVGFIDASGEIDPESIRNLLTVYKKGSADVVIGSKRHQKSLVEYPFHRRVLSSGYLFLVKLLFATIHSDTQAGVKIFDKKVLKKIMPLLEVNSKAFDIELLELAKLSGFGNILEAPIIVRKKSKDINNLSSYYDLFVSSFRMFYDTFLFFIRLKILQTYQNKL